MEYAPFLNIKAIITGKKSNLLNLSYDLDKKLDEIVYSAFNKDTITRNYPQPTFKQTTEVITKIIPLDIALKNMDLPYIDEKLTNELSSLINTLISSYPTNNVQTLFGMDVKPPSLYNQLDFVRLFEGIIYPVEVLRNVVADATTLKQVDTIANTYPELYAVLKEKIMVAAGLHKKPLTRKQNQHLSILLQVPRINPVTLEMLKAEPKEEAGANGNLSIEGDLSTEVQTLTNGE